MPLWEVDEDGREVCRGGGGGGGGGKVEVEETRVRGLREGNVRQGWKGMEWKEME